MKVRRIETGTIGNINSVFVTFYTKAYHHYQTNEECRSWGETAWNSKIALLGLVKRWDASLGFIGGKVDEGETLLQAAVRETKEESGYTIPEERLAPFCTHWMNDNGFEQHTHVFLCEVTPDEMYEIQKSTATAQHSRVEAAGFNVVHMVKESFTNLRACQWAGTGKEELEILLASGLIEAPTIQPNGTF